MSNSLDFNPLAPWTVQVPANWWIFRLGAVADIIFSNVDKHTFDGEIPIRLCNYMDVYKNGQITSQIDFMPASALPREIEKFQVRMGDILATKDSENPFDIAVSALVAEELPSVLCGYHLALIRPHRDKILGSYLAWIHASKPILAQYEAQAVGVTRFALSQSAFKEAVIPLPPLEEQHRIATYLDEQTAKIDHLIGLRQRQIELLREQRAALIQQAVTRGFNPDVPMRDSGIPWLGEIPAHWSIVPLGHLSTLLQTGPFGSQLHADEYIEGGIPVINPSHLADGRINHDPKCSVTTATANRLARHTLVEGDIVFARRGDLGRCGLVTVEEVGWLCGTGSLLMRPQKSALEPAYLVSLFQLRRLKEALSLN